MRSFDICGDLPPSYDVAVSGDYVESSTSTRGSYFQSVRLSGQINTYFLPQDDGRVDVTFTAKQPGLEALLQSARPPEEQPSPGGILEAATPMNVVIQIVGSRGMYPTCFIRSLCYFISFYLFYLRYSSLFNAY